MTHLPDALHKMCEVVHSGDVVIVRLKYNIWIDTPAMTSEFSI